MSDNKTEKQMTNELVETKEVKTGVSEKTPVTSVSLTRQDIEKLDYVDFNTPARLLALSEVLVKSSLCPLKTKEDAFLVIKTGQELGLPFTASISQIYPINGRPTLGVHLMRAIILKTGIYFKKVRDAEEYYEFAIKKGDKNVIVKKGFLDEQPDGTSKRKVDIKTEYLFRREIRTISGKFETIEAKSSYSISEATLAGLIEKDVWVKHYPRMLDSRAFSIGAREIADDLLNGIYSISEMADTVEDIDYTIDDEGVETIIVSNENNE